MRIRTSVFAAVALVASLTVGVVAVEMVLGGLTESRCYVWPPNLTRTFLPDPERMPGVAEPAHFSINREGVRGNLFSPDQDYRILAIGGSTTECLFLDDTEAWPFLVQQLLNDRLADRNIWVGNVGKSALDSRHHRFQVETLLRKHPRVDLVLVLVGVNDFQRQLSHEDNLPAAASDPRRVIQEALAVCPQAYTWLPFYKKTEIWKRCRRIKQRFTAGDKNGAAPIQDLEGRAYREWQLRREEAEDAGRIRDKLPDLSPALRQYGENVRAMIEAARSAGTEIIFMTQPSIWRTDLSERARRLLWLGGVGRFQVESGADYYSVEALAKGMEMYNRKLRETCEASSVTCIDLAAEIPRNLDFFYDDVHFNEKGARLVAEVVARFLEGS